MSKKTTYPYLVVLFVFIFSCQRSTDPLAFTPPEFKNVFDVSTFEINIDRPFNSISKIETTNNNLIIKAYDGEFNISVFDKKSCEYLFGFAPVGRGPGEVSSNILEFYILQDSLYLLDIKNNVIKINPIPERSSKNENPINTKLKGFNWFTDAIPLTAGMFVSTPTIDARFALHNYKGDTLSSYFSYPKYKEVDDRMLLFQLYRARQELGVKPDGLKFVATCSLGMVLEIFSIENKKIKLETEKRFYPLLHTVLKNGMAWPHPDCITGILDIKTTNDFIYALFSGKPVSQKNSGTCGNYIYVFDWKGDPVKAYKLKDNIRKFSLDYELNKVYVVKVNEDGSETLAAFDL